MKLVFCHENRLLVSNAKNLLDELGIASFIKNEFAAGGVGDLSPFDTWPELWVVEDSEFQTAKMHLETNLTAAEDGPDWLCRRCGEANSAGFEICWNCQQEKDSG